MCPATAIHSFYAAGVVEIVSYVYECLDSSTKMRDAPELTLLPPLLESFVPSTLSSLIAASEKGDRSATEALFSALYSELHRLAKQELALHGVAVTLSVTTLLHEAYLDMAERDGPSFPDEARFMGYAARVMRGLIVDHARNRQAQKRGGMFEITALGPEAA